jgi:hypothetical protein
VQGALASVWVVDVLPVGAGVHDTVADVFSLVKEDPESSQLLILP